MGDAGHAGIGPDARDTHVERAVPVERPGKDLRAGGLVHRQRLSRQRRLVGLARAPDHHAVDGDAIARTDQDGLADGDRFHRHALVAAVAADQCLARREIQQGADGVAGALQRAGFEPLREGEQEHDAGRLGPFADRQRSRDGQDHQDVDVQAARPDGGHGPLRGRHHAGADGRQIRHRGQRRHADPVGGQARGQRRARRQHEPGAPGIGRARVERRLVLEPHAQASVGRGVHHRGRGQPRRVVRDAQALGHHVRRKRLDARKGLEPALQDGHFVAAVQALHAEYRFRVHLTHAAGSRLGAGRHRPVPRRSSSACRSPS